jgi:multidrug resistance efflux pump
MVNLTDVPGAISPAVERLVDAHERPMPRRGLDLKKWRARVAVLLMISAAVFAGAKLVHVRDVASAKLGLGTVTLTAAGIPVESVTPGRVTSVSVQAQQRVSAGERLGTLVATTTSPSGVPGQKTVVLTAPSNGIVTSDPTPVGTALQSGQPFVQIYDPSQLRFVASVRAADLTRLSRGMVVTLKADGLLQPIKAVVDRAVPQVVQANQVGQTGSSSGPLQLVLVPKNIQDVGRLVPGLQFTGEVDTTSSSGPSLDGLNPTP